MNAANDPRGLSLPGYTLSRRLGAGGYGEVWLAHAPGGLTKAVKFIFGSYNDKRAEHELRALQKVKEVRHPFLLSLERIEVVDGRLVIVTELADASLKDRFDECVKQGLPGIPRAELLGYMRDAADALDFLSKGHSLQHLDVKPENLLMLAGHVKVADFGLVKDVGKSQASLVGGLTPLYSAPEVFQGAPSTFSDQYSLAVLYQEMLTGILPFSGATAAELTMQHLHEEPDLTPLPTSDRYLASRALAKEPTRRFASCMEFITALLAADQTAPLAGTETAVDWSMPAARDLQTPLPADRQPGPVTEFFGDDEGPKRGSSASLLLDLDPPKDEPPVVLPPIDVPAEGFSPQPTLLVGIGGAACEVLKQLRQRMARQFNEAAVPAVQMLLLDSDPKTIARAMQGDARTALKPEETLTLALRRPQEYREQSTRLMRWLSRRWLYNIPRSLRTEGMRPLGRLALADHARQVVQRLRMSLAAAAEPDAVEASTAATKLPFQQAAPRVFVVASASGGSGSGMSIDVGYALRAALDKMNAPSAEIVGIFLHGSGRDPRHCDLAKVNTYAWLTEYNHFHRPGATFPGDESCGLPAMPAGRVAFDSAYLVDVGLESEDGVGSPAIQEIADYLYLDVLTPAHRFFAACRQDGKTAGQTAPLRTLSVQKTAATSEDAFERAAAALAREVVLSWTGEVASVDSPANAAAAASNEVSLRDTNQIVQGAATLVGQLQLKLEGLASNARMLIDGQFGGDHQEFLANFLTTATPQSGKLTAVETLRAVDRLFAPPHEEERGSFILQRPLDAIVSPLSMKLANDLATWVLRRLDDQQERLAGAQRAAQWLVDHLKRLDADATRLGEGLTRQCAAFAEEVRNDSRADSAKHDAALARTLNYFRMRIDLTAVHASGLIAKRLLAELKSISGTVAEFGRHIKHIANSLPNVAAADGAPNGVDDPLLAVLGAHMPELKDSVAAQLQQQFIDEQGGLFPTIMGNSRIRAQMLTTLQKLARQEAEKLAARPDVIDAALAGLVNGESANGAAADLPRFLQRGGAYRKLSVVPADAPLSGGASLALGSDGSIVAVPGADLITVCEGWQMPLASIARELIQNRRDYADFAGRVQTRSDVAWTPLNAPVIVPAAAFAFAVTEAFPGAGDCSPTMTQILSQ
jgi:serine/threonine protein kinase